MHLEGNLKYDASAAAKPSELPTFGAENVWIAASTVAPNESGITNTTSTKTTSCWPHFGS